MSSIDQSHSSPLSKKPASLSGSGSPIRDASVSTYHIHEQLLVLKNELVPLLPLLSRHMACYLNRLANSALEVNHSDLKKYYLLAGHTEHAALLLSYEKLMARYPAAINSALDLVNQLANCLSTSKTTYIKVLQEQLRANTQQFKQHLIAHFDTQDVTCRCDTADLTFQNVLGLSDKPKTERMQSYMHQYQPTPLRFFLPLLDSLKLTAHDCFFDLGSGQSMLAAAVNLFSPAQSVAIEYQHLLHTEAVQMLQRNTLTRVTSINADVRDVDYSPGNIFFFFNPFSGPIMEKVVEKLRAQDQYLKTTACSRPLTICSFGMSTVVFEKERSWLPRINQRGYGYEMAIFQART